MTVAKTNSRSAETTERQARINALAELVSYRYDDLFDAFGVKPRRFGKTLRCSCPIHGGNSGTALTYYPDGQTMRGYWRCQTRHCEKHFLPTIIGLTRGMLSHERHNWQKFGDKQVSFKETIDFLCGFVGKKLNEIDVNMEEVDRKKFFVKMERLGFAPQQKAEGWNPDQIRNRLAIPSAYFLARGFSEQVLKRYDVGNATVPDQTNPMFNRSVVPVYTEDYSRVIGVTARSVYPICPQCELCHKPDDRCPQTEDERLRCSKWRNSKGFAKERHLYNWWFAKNYIRETGTVVIVESPGNVWRLEEAGIHNSVGLFGSELTDPQQCLLETSGAMHVVLVLDNDEAGRLGADKIRSLLERSYRVTTLWVPNNDIAEMSVSDVKTFFQGVL